MREFVSGMELGYPPLVFCGRVEQNSNLFKKLGTTQNVPKLVLLSDGAFGFKYLIEKAELAEIKTMMVDIKTTSRAIKEKLHSE